MNRAISKDLIVGVFAFVSLIIMVILSLEVNGKGTIGKRAQTFYADFDSVSGLVERTPVEVAGINSGYIESIELLNDKAKITIKLKHGIKVYKDARLTIRDRGLLGDKYVELTPGTFEKGPLLSGQSIGNTQSGSDFESLQRTLNETTQVIKDLLQSDNPTGALGQTIVNLRDATGRINELVGQNQAKISSILDNIDHFSGDLKDFMQENKGQMHDVLVSMQEVSHSLKKTLGEDGRITQASQKLDETIASIQRIVQKVEKGEGTIGRLLNDESTVQKLNDTIDGVNDTLGLFRRVQLGVRYRGEFLASNQKLQNLIGITIWPSPDKFLLLELVDAPVGETSFVDTSISANGTPISTTRTVTTNDKILYNLQLGKRFWDATIRVGIMRNEGGVGLDYHLFKDKFVVSAETFNFSRFNDRFHFRAYGTLFLYKNLLLTTGMDDILSRNGNKNFFVGAGIQFRDNDFKALLPAMGNAL